MAIAVFLWSPVIMTVEMPGCPALGDGRVDLLPRRIDHGRRARGTSGRTRPVFRPGSQAHGQMSAAGHGQDAEGLVGQAESIIWRSGPGRSFSIGRASAVFQDPGAAVEENVGSALDVSRDASRSRRSRRMMVIRLRSESKGISSTKGAGRFEVRPCAVRLWPPRVRSAPSVGSPRILSSARPSGRARRRCRGRRLPSSPTCRGHRRPEPAVRRG